MITKDLIKEKSEELNIPFKNLLAGAVCENIIDILSSGQYCNELYLCNIENFTVEAYQKHISNNIYFEYSRELDKKLETLYVRDVLKDLISRAAYLSMTLTGHVEENVIRLEVIVDSMFVPINIIFSSSSESLRASEMETINLVFSGRAIKLLVSSKEELLIKDLYEIVQMLELINNMDCYYEAYSILTKYPINGRRIKDGLSRRLNESDIEISEFRMKAIEGYENYTYMKKKWKVELRQKKTSQPDWQDVIICLSKFLRPIWEAMENNMIFLGDWMPQIKRFLD